MSRVIGCKVNLALFTAAIFDNVQFGLGWRSRRLPLAAQARVKGNFNARHIARGPIAPIVWLRDVCCAGCE
jgi:hypothetical protein